jgi:phosphonate transport system ATP-binding protein
VAVARSMAQEANILLADEPIANLDPMNAELVLKTLKEISRENNITIIVNLHQIDMAIKYFDRIIGFGNGAVTYDSLYYGKFDMTHYEKIYK